MYMFFFFKQKTAYEMRISDWSSDVCSSDLQIYIEVPCFDWIVEHSAWFDVFYEHVNYFRLADLRAMFGTVHEAGHLFGGQYLYIVADLSTLCCTPAEAPQPLKTGRAHV